MARVLVISPVPTHPPAAGNRVRILALLDHLETAGHEVHLLHAAHEPGDADAMRARWGARFHPVPCRSPRRPKLRPWYLPYWTRRAALALVWREPLSRHTYALDDWYDPQLDPVLRDLQARHLFDAVFVEYVFLSRAFLLFGGGTLKILDTMDVFANRHLRYLAHGAQPSYFSCSVADEDRALDRADAVLAIQEEEAAYFRAHTTRPVLHAGHPAPGGDATPLPEAPRLLFVGYSNAVNREAVTYFVEEILPRVRKRVPETTLMLAGDICDVVPDTSGVDKRGRVERLGSIYAEARCVVNTRPFGTGLSIKSIEAMAHARPLVATPSGALGLEAQAGKALIVANGAEAFAEAVVRVLTDRAFAERLAKNAAEFTREYNAHCFSELDALLASRLERKK